MSTSQNWPAGSPGLVDFIDRDGKIAIYLTNPAQRGRAVEMLTPVLGSRRFSARMARPVVSELRVYQGQYDFLQLRELNRRMSSVLLIPGVVFTDSAGTACWLPWSMRRRRPASKPRCSRTTSRGTR